MSLTHPENDAPKQVQEFLAKIGGKVPGQDRPMWRIVLAQNCVAKRGGILHEIEGEAPSIFSPGPDGKTYYSRPHDSVTAGMIELPKYVCEGWIVEKWFPPSTWGTPEEWAGHKAEDGSRLLCEDYPSRGDYWMLIGPFEHIPELTDLETAIRMHQQSEQNRPANYDAYFRQVMRDEAAARAIAKAKMVADLNYRRKNELVPVLKSTSLEAQRFRNQLTEATGLQEHLGAVHNA